MASPSPPLASSLRTRRERGRASRNAWNLPLPPAPPAPAACRAQNGKTKVGGSRAPCLPRLLAPPPRRNDISLDLDRRRHRRLTRPATTKTTTTMSSTRPPLERQVISIQSHVVCGYAGNKSATFPLQLHGYDVCPINSVHFSNHTGYGTFRGQVLNGTELLDIVAGIEANGLLTPGGCGDAEVGGAGWCWGASISSCPTAYSLCPTFTPISFPPPTHKASSRWTLACATFAIPSSATLASCTSRPSWSRCTASVSSALPRS